MLACVYMWMVYGHVCAGLCPVHIPRSQRSSLSVLFSLSTYSPETVSQ